MFVKHVIKRKLLFIGCLVNGRFVPWTFVPKTIRTQAGRFVPSGLDVSYPKSGRFVPKGWTFRTQGLVNCLGGLPRNSVARLTDRARNDLKCVEGP